MAALPLPGQGQRPSLDPDEVGYVKPSQMAEERAKALLHTSETCTAEHCSCHLPTVFNPPSLNLTAREAFVLAWHLFPLKDDEELSFEDIGKRLGVTPVRVRQIYMRAAAKIRAHGRVWYPVRPGETQDTAPDPAAYDDEMEPNDP